MKLTRQLILAGVFACCSVSVSAQLLPWPTDPEVSVSDKSGTPQESAMRAAQFYKRLSQSLKNQQSEPVGAAGSSGAQHINEVNINIGPP